MNAPHALTLFRGRQDPPMTQQALGALLGVATPTVSRWESGKRKIDDDKVELVSEKTGIPVPELRPDLAKLFGEAAE